MILDPYSLGGRFDPAGFASECNTITALKVKHLIEIISRGVSILFDDPEPSVAPAWPVILELLPDHSSKAASSRPPSSTAPALPGTR